jgi:uncharacterized hydrophobic protein (TIGR00271 family)
MGDSGRAGEAGADRGFAAWLAGIIPQVPPERRRDVLGSLFKSAAERRSYLLRFSALLTASVVIATFGILADSPAVVIGAMLIAPLMTPVLGIASAAVMAWGKRLTQTALQVAAGTAGAIAVAWLLAFFLPESRFADGLPGELLARTEPTHLDLFIALAAGAAGAYIHVRKEELSALPGVAIAVALVPPLATVGISLHYGLSSEAEGAFLLYITNLAGIILAAMTVFVITGFVPRSRLQAEFRMIRRGFLLAGAAALVLFVPLVIHSIDIVQDAKDEASAHAAVREWMEQTPLNDVVGLSIESDLVVVDIIGPEEPAPVGQLAAMLGDDKAVRIEWAEASLREYIPGNE